MWKVSHYLQEKAAEQKPICSKIQDTHGNCMIKILLVHHSYWWQKHSCFAQVRLYLFFFKHKETSLRVHRCSKLMIFSNIEAKILWFPCLKKRLSETPFYSTINLKRHTVEALTYPIQCKVILSTYTDGIKKEPPRVWNALCWSDLSLSSHPCGCLLRIYYSQYPQAQ